MSVPNLKAIVVKRHKQFGPLTSKARCGQFTEAVVVDLHAIDPNFGHLRKFGSSTQYHGHGVDVVLYKATGQAVDIIKASKLASDTRPCEPTWGVEREARYTDSDTYWMPPIGVPDPPPAPAPTPRPTPAPSVCKPAHAYADQMSMTARCAEAYLAACGRAIHSPLVSHLIYRYQFERYTLEALVEEATRRGAEDAA